MNDDHNRRATHTTQLNSSLVQLYNYVCRVLFQFQFEIIKIDVNYHQQPLNTHTPHTYTLHTKTDIGPGPATYSELK